MIRVMNAGANEEGCRKGLEFVGDFFRKAGMDKQQALRAVPVVDEAVESLYEHRKSDEDRIHIRAAKYFGTVVIELSMRGEPYDLTEHMPSALPDSEDYDSPETQSVIRGILLRSLAEDLKYRHRNGVNHIRITLKKTKKAFLFLTLGALALAVAAGLLLSEFGPESFNTGLNTYLLSPVKTMYLNALKTMVAPVVFFSIISCVVQFSDLSALGRIGGKTVGLYMLTTVVAVLAGFGVYYLFLPGNAGVPAAGAADASSITSQTMNVSLKDTVVNIVPSNFLKPFLDADMLQLIFLAVVSGIAASLIGKYSQTLKDFFQACNDLFLKITTLIIRMMPVAVFCSITSMIITTGFDSILSVLGIVGTFLAGLLGMMCIYCLLILAVGRMNPVPFVRKYAPVMLQVFSMASSNAAIPLNMDACEKKLGISGKVYSLSIPLGATVNMDGTCVYLAVFSLALAALYGVPVPGGTLLSLAIFIVILSIGAPGVAGSGLICLSVLLTQLNVPVEAVGLVMGIDAFIGMFRCMSNCLGDVAVSVVVAKSEKEIDMDTYSR